MYTPLLFNMLHAVNRIVSILMILHLETILIIIWLTFPSIPCRIDDHMTWEPANHLPGSHTYRYHTVIQKHIKFQYQRHDIYHREWGWGWKFRWLNYADPFPITSKNHSKTFLNGPKLFMTLPFASFVVFFFFFFWGGGCCCLLLLSFSDITILVIFLRCVMREKKRSNWARWSPLHKYP